MISGLIHLWNWGGADFTAEVFGIFATVMIIDKIIRGNEKKKWHPTTQYVYCRITDLVGRVLNSVIPSECIAGSNIYRFGAYEAWVPQLKKDYDGEDGRYEIISKIRHDYEHLVMLEEVDPGRAHSEISKLTKSMRVSREACERILAMSQHIIPAEISSLICEFETCMSRVESLSGYTTVQSTTLKIYAIDVIEKAMALTDGMLKHSEKSASVISEKEYLTEIGEKLAKWGEEINRDKTKGN